MTVHINDQTVNRQACRLDSSYLKLWRDRTGINGNLFYIKGAEQLKACLPNSDDEDKAKNRYKHTAFM